MAGAKAVISYRLKGTQKKLRKANVVYLVIIVIFFNNFYPLVFIKYYNIHLNMKFSSKLEKFSSTMFCTVI